MDMVPLAATGRQTDVLAKNLRKEGKVPCVVYGNKAEHAQLQCEYMELYKAYAKAGENTVVNLSVDGKDVPVLFHIVEVDPLSDDIIHVDFYAVDMKKEVEAQVPVHFTGTAPAVEDMGGVMLTTQDHVTVRCLPANLPHELSVSIESLVDFNATVTVADIAVPENVTIVDEPEIVLATAQEPRKEEEPEAEEGAEGEAAEGETAEGEAAEGGSEGEGGDTSDS